MNLEHRVSSVYTLALYRARYDISAKHAWPYNTRISAEYMTLPFSGPSWGNSIQTRKTTQHTRVPRQVDTRHLSSPPRKPRFWQTWPLRFTDDITMTQLMTECMGDEIPCWHTAWVMDTTPWRLGTTGNEARHGLTLPGWHSLAPDRTAEWGWPWAQVQVRSHSERILVRLHIAKLICSPQTPHAESHRHRARGVRGKLTEAAQGSGARGLSPRWPPTWEWTCHAGKSEGHTAAAL